MNEVKILGENVFVTDLHIRFYEIIEKNLLLVVQKSGVSQSAE